MPSSVFTACGAGTAILAGCMCSANPSPATSKRSRSSGTGSGRSCGTVQQPMVEVFGCEARRSPIDLAEHDVEGADDCRDVGQHVSARKKIHRLQVRERGGADLALVRSVGAVGNEIDPELALRCLHRRIYLSRRHTEAFGVELKMMDERFHRALHDFTPGRHDL